MAEEVFISYGSADRERIQRVEYFEGNEDESIGGVLRALKRLGISTNSDSENQARNQVSASEPQGKAKSPHWPWPPSPSSPCLHSFLF